MIYGIGTDIIEISRIEKAIQKKSFIQNIFTKNEIKKKRNIFMLI